MPLVPAKCPNCGGMIQIEADNRAGICAFCKQPFVSEDAINNYNTYNNTYNQNTYNVANADLHINDEKGVENRLNSAEVFLGKLNQPTKARELFKSVTEDAPGDYRGWWGLVRVETNQLNLPKDLTNMPRGVVEYVENAIAVADDEPIKKNIKKEWNHYIESASSRIKSRIDILNRENTILESKKNKIETEKSELEIVIGSNTRDRESASKLLQEEINSLNDSVRGSSDYIRYLKSSNNDSLAGFFAVVATLMFFVGIVISFKGCWVVGDSNDYLISWGWGLMLGGPIGMPILGSIISKLRQMGNSRQISKIEDTKSKVADEIFAKKEKLKELSETPYELKKKYNTIDADIRSIQVSINDNVGEIRLLGDIQEELASCKIL